jgi:hypothetical protein
MGRHRIHNPPTGTYPEPIESTSPPSSLSPQDQFDPIPHLCFGLHSRLFPPGFSSKTLYSFITSPLRDTCPAHLIPRDLICLQRPNIQGLIHKCLNVDCTVNTANVSSECSFVLYYMWHIFIDTLTACSRACACVRVCVCACVRVCVCACVRVCARARV